MKIINIIVVFIISISTAVAKDIDVQLFSASASGDIDKVQSLVKDGANVNSRKNPAKITPLNVAAYKGHNKVVKYLINNGADKNSANAKGFTPLIIASLKGHASVVKTLLNSKASIHLKDKKGFTALTHAASTGNIKMCSLLIKYGAKVNNVNSDGISPLLLAILNGKSKTVEFLLSQGANPSQQIVMNNNKMSLEYIAKQKGLNNIVAMLNKYKK